MRAMNQNIYRAKIKRRKVKIMLDFSESTVYDADNQTREGGYY